MSCSVTVRQRYKRTTWLYFLLKNLQIQWWFSTQLAPAQNYRRVMTAAEKWFCQLNFTPKRRQRWASYNCASSLTSDKAIFQPTRVSRKHWTVAAWRDSRGCEEEEGQRERERERGHRLWKEEQNVTKDIETRWIFFFSFRFSKWQSVCTFPSIHNALTAKNPSRVCSAPLFAWLFFGDFLLPMCVCVCVWLCWDLQVQPASEQLTER